MGKDKSKDSGNAAYEEFLASLSPRARKAIQSRGSKPLIAVEDEEEEYQLWRNGLSEKARAWADQQGPVEEKQEDISEDAVLRFCCVECESGEFPVVRMFKSAEALARHMSKLEGQDVCVVPFWGNFMKFSKGPVRYMCMPDRESALVIPRDGEVKVDRVPLDEIEFDWQDDGFVGPHALANSTFMDQLDEMAKEGQDEDTDEDDDDDDDDADDGLAESGEPY